MFALINTAISGTPNPLSAIPFIILFFVGFGLPLGVIPAMLLVCLSRARHAPWRAVPVLTVGTVGGIIAILVPLFLTRLYIGGWFWIVLVGAPTSGGIVAALFIRQPRI